MNNRAFNLLALFLLASSTFAQKQIVVSNSSNLIRKAEMVEVKVADLKLKSQSTNYVLRNSNHQEISYQWVFKGNKTAQYLIFQADVTAKSKSVYYLTKGTPAVTVPRTFARFVPERKDDFAWENDLCAYRMYGPALVNENPSNGVDIWLKCTDNLVVDKRYFNELQKGISYHVDHGDGLDCYKVGHTLGAGGIAPYVDGKLSIGTHYSSYKIVESGPLRTTFCLTYDSVMVGADVYKQTITITTTAGTMLNKAVVRYEGLKKTIKLAAGIYLHDKKGLIKEDAKNGIIAYAEDAFSDSKNSVGRNYVGAYMPKQFTQTKLDDVHVLLLADYNVGNDHIYYFGGGWSKWKFKTDKEWLDAMLQFSITQQQPLKVTIK